MFGQSEENIERSSSFIIHQDLGSSVLCVVRRWKQRLTYVVQTCLLIKVIPFPERRNDWLNQSINPSRAVPRLCTDQKLVSYCCTMLYIVVVVSYDGLFWFAQCNAMNAMQWMQCNECNAMNAMQMNCRQIFLFPNIPYPWETTCVL
jgi:hypothetical protein